MRWENTPLKADCEISELWFYHLSHQLQQQSNHQCLCLILACLQMMDLIRWPCPACTIFLSTWAFHQDLSVQEQSIYLLEVFTGCKKERKKKKLLERTVCSKASCIVASNILYMQGINLKDGRTFPYRHASYLASESNGS